MRRAAVFLTAASLLGLTACLEFDEVLTEITWDEAQQTFAIRSELRGLGGSSFDCDTVETCVPILEEVVNRPTDIPDVLEMAGKGAEDLAVSLAREGDRLDLVIEYVAPLGTPAAEAHGLLVEMEGKEGRERSRLVLALSDERTPVDVKRYKRRVQLKQGAEFGEIIEQEYWVLPRRVNSVTTHTAVDWSGMGDYRPVPILQAVPGLAEALEAEGLLAPADNS